MASGDLRLSANQKCWPAQYEMEQQLIAAIEKQGYLVTRAHDYNHAKQHGFIDSQKMGMEIFRGIDENTPLIVAESVWQYTHHVLPGLITHKGPILTIANWSGQWPGLVGVLNLNGSLTKANVKYSSLWSKDFTDSFFETGLKQWLESGDISHNTGHVQPFEQLNLSAADSELAAGFASAFKKHKWIMGVFDEGCMGMFNAIVPDDLLHNLGIFKERLSQSALYAAMLNVSDTEAGAVLTWLVNRGMIFNWGEDEETQLTRRQTLEQCKMYIAAARIANDFGCATIGIQYQQGLKDLVGASDLVEGLLNNTSRPPAYAENGDELFAGQAIPHFNEVDECAGIDALIINKLWTQLGLPPENTLHDIRWGEHYTGNGIDDFVWTFLISGAAPPEHFIGGYKGAYSDRQSPMYFRLGGGSLRGVSKPGNIVWSRVYVKDNQLHYDTGVGKVVLLPEEETNRRWQQTTPEWPIMHAVLPGISRDQMMARHKANHIHVVYAGDEASAERACKIKAAVMAGLGMKVYICGNLNIQN